MIRTIFTIRNILLSFFFCFALALAFLSFDRAASADGLLESCRPKHDTALDYFDSMRVISAHVVSIEDGVVYTSFKYDVVRYGSDAPVEEIVTKSLRLTDESVYPAEFLKQFDKREWLIIFCDDHDAIYKIEAAK